MQGGDAFRTLSRLGTLLMATKKPTRQQQVKQMWLDQEVVRAVCIEAFNMLQHLHERCGNMPYPEEAKRLLLQAQNALGDLISFVVDNEQ